MFFHAYELIRKASNLNDNHSEILKWKCKILIKMEEFSEAEKHIRLYLNQAYKSSEAFSMLGWVCLNSKKFQEAEDYFARALIIDPRDSLARKGIIKCARL
jgi:Tfp pilus assembly protein PilF